jgi:serine/threonine-protein kinase
MPRPAGPTQGLACASDDDVRIAAFAVGRVLIRLDALGFGVAQSPLAYGASACSLSGRVLGGRYEIIGALAHGGMAEVYLARQVGMDGFEKLVAVKCVAERYGKDEYFVAMFLDEARTAADLRHPNVVQLYEVGVDAEITFIAMEFLDGASVSTLQRESVKYDRHIPIDVAMQITRDAAAGLHYAHTKTGLDGRPLGIVHRDVSPQNIFATVDGVAKILDFGIAKAASRSVETTGGLKGKIPYMAPEQTRGETVDARTDLFALGIVLWEMTCGRRLFGRDNDALALDAVRECRPPRPSTLVPGYPQLLEDVVLRALAARPADRFRDCAELVTALERVEGQLDIVPRASRVATFLQEVMLAGTLPDPTEGPRAMLHAPEATTATAIVRVVGRRPAPPSAATVPAPVGGAARTEPTLSPDERAAVGQQRRRWPTLAAALSIAAAVSAVGVWRAALPSDDDGSGGDAPTTPKLAAPQAPPVAPTPAQPPVPSEDVLRPAAPPLPSEPEPEPALEPEPATVLPKRPRGGRAEKVDTAKVDAARPSGGTGSLSFPDQDPYFMVHIDGAVVGPTPILRLRVPAGPHVIELRAADTGVIASKRNVDVVANSAAEIRAR